MQRETERPRDCLYVCVSLSLSACLVHVRGMDVQGDEGEGQRDGKEPCARNTTPR